MEHIAERLAELQAELAAARARAESLERDLEEARRERDAYLREMDLGAHEHVADVARMLEQVKELAARAEAAEASLAALREALQRIAQERYTAQILLEDNATEAEQVDAWSRDSIDRQAIARRALASSAPQPAATAPEFEAWVGSEDVTFACAADQSESMKQHNLAQHWACIGVFSTFEDASAAAKAWTAAPAPAAASTDPATKEDRHG